MKNNFFSIISLAVSVISLLASGYIICSENRFNADWYAIVISVLSLLVTVLVGWQILTVISIEKTIEKRMNEKIAEYDTVVDYRANRALYLALTNIASVMQEQFSCLSSFDMYIRAALIATKMGDEENVSICMDKAIEVFDVMMTHKAAEKDRRVFLGRYRSTEHYVDLISLISDKRKTLLISKICDARKLV